MEERKQPSPTKLAVRCAGGWGLLLGTMLAVMVLPASRLRASGTQPCSDSGCDCGVLLWRLIPFLALVVSGGAIAWRTRRRLERGVREGIWQNDELEPLRNWIDHCWIKRLIWLPMICGVVSLIAARDWHSMGMLYVFMLPSTARTGIGTCLQPVQSVTAQNWDWHTWPRLRSEHWGHGCATDGNSAAG